MKSKLVYLNDLSGDKASIYSIVTADSRIPFWDQFLKDNQKEFFQDVLSIIRSLKIIGYTTGAINGLLKLDEGLEWNDLVCALYDTPAKHLRLYCIRVSENIVIVGNGGPKKVRAWQQDSKLTKEVNEMMHYSKIIRAKLKDGSLRISENHLFFEGDFILTR